MYGLSIAVLLVSLAVGYRVLLRAEEAEKSYLKNTGRLLAAVIIIVSLISVSCAVYKVHCLKRSGTTFSKCPLKNVQK